MARLVSDIGIAQRKHTANARKAEVYRQMAAAIEAGDEATIAALPTYVPRGKAPEWYRERAARAEQVSATAGEMAGLLVDMERRNRLDAMTPEEAWIDLVEGREFPGTTYRQQGRLHSLDVLVDALMEDIPYLAPKLSTEQRHHCQQFIRAMMEGLIQAFERCDP
jgi:hypothetical protein